MSNIAVREKLVEDLRRSARKELPAEELQRQRVSYVMGSLKGDSGISREQVRKILETQDGYRKD